MGQRKGQTGNPNGRPTGTPNKVTSNLREFVKRLIDDNAETISADLAAMDAKDRMQVFIKLIEYIIPKKREIEDNNEEERKRDEFLRELFGYKKTA
jgi:hypothetical protein